ncbi:MAG TPA: histidinol-phosphate transaminase [Flavisolibacter sp.]|jgi:histidinol-phosphate aminotransferase|nr:histidinol-phosphate transaminase [Flavisolibacter sp.]
MGNQINRRNWLKQSAFALTAIGVSPPLFSNGLYEFPQRPPEADNLILLNGNENPYGPSPLARKAILQHHLSSNRYPDNFIASLKRKIASHWNVKEQNILLGAGSSEIIGLACQLAAAKSKGHIITAEPSYKVWNSQATAIGLSFKRNPLPQNSVPNLFTLFGPITKHTGMVYICNPNNPTGTVLDVKEIEAFALKVPKHTYVFVDEAYTEYAGLSTLAPLAIKHPNIIVAKTFSKIYGLAGARVGYAIAHPQTIEALSAFQPWPDANVSSVSANAAMAALDDQGFVHDCREKAAQAREICYTTFRKLDLKYIPSSANFVLFNIDKLKRNLIDEMKQRNIEVQFREHYGGKWCRVSMGTIEEMQLFTKALGEIVAGT